MNFTKMTNVTKRQICHKEHNGNKISLTNPVKISKNGRTNTINFGDQIHFRIIRIAGISCVCKCIHSHQVISEKREILLSYTIFDCQLNNLFLNYSSHN